MERHSSQGGNAVSKAEISVAENLRALRKARDLSLDQLSRLSGVSKSMLRQIEIERSSPTISVLWKIANGLRVPFSALIARKALRTEAADFTSRGTIRSGRRGYRLYPVVEFQPERPVEIYYTEMDAGVRFDGEPHQGSARETVLVIAGTVRVTVGNAVSMAGRDQVIQFPAGQPHRYENPGEVAARMLMTIDYAV
jgi:XRE family transcriptional regulator, regulator of sulfur utilization